MAGYDPKSLHRRWVHSHEEDSDEEMVFRPAGYALPPARGRTSLELRPDGTLVESSPGPVDVPVQSTGRWSLEGERLVLEGAGDQPKRTWEITAAGEDRLAIKK